ncbi:espin-like protein [Eucyclogobius newberryi]|uniref:espin-like protein n=1 Tax=Eucyclogobius newberryi TaxID=166745 RepID=UPI003B5BE4F9
MTEADLNRIEKQIENLQLMNKVSEVEKELEALERELHQLLPVSAALNQGHFSVNPKQVHGQAEDLPAWCNKISTLLKSMALLLATLGGKQIDILELIYSPEEAQNVAPTQEAGPNNGCMGRSLSFSTREDVENEIRQCGVSVKNLKANYEVENQPQTANDKRVYKRKRSLPVVSEEDNAVITPPTQTNGHLAPVEPPAASGQEPVTVAHKTHVPSGAMAPNNLEQFNQVLSSDPILNNDQFTRSLEVQTDFSYVQECIDMRKERIVFLFLEHWRKYTMTESYRPKSRKGSHLVVGWEDYNQFSADLGEGVQSEDDKLLLFMKSKQVVGNLIGHWRLIMSQVPTRQIRRLSRAQMIYWPEHFLPHVNGSPVSYESLTLDLFMLGYFQLLEMNMSRNERKFRHLLCYEMFDRLGSHKWEVIRDFHKEVMTEIEKDKRDWGDGFEDIKQKYFGDTETLGGVLTASLNSMAPDAPMPEALPPPPSHPPPPPPPSHPAPPPPTLESDPPQSAPPASPSNPTTHPPSGNSGASEKSQGKETSEDRVQKDPQTAASPDATAVANRSSSERDPGQTTDTAQTSHVTCKAEAQDKQMPNSEAEKEVVPGSVKIIEEPQVNKPQPKSGSDSIKTIYELKEFSNEEIIRYIDRSFAFWKEKEAELFDI